MRIWRRVIEVLIGLKQLHKGVFREEEFDAAEKLASAKGDGEKERAEQLAAVQAAEAEARAELEKVRSAAESAASEASADLKKATKLAKKLGAELKDSRAKLTDAEQDAEEMSAASKMEISTLKAAVSAAEELKLKANETPPTQNNRSRNFGGVCYDAIAKTDENQSIRHLNSHSCLRWEHCSY